MNVIIQKDKRSPLDRQYDDLWNKLVRDANLSSMQRTLVARYLRAIISKRFEEIVEAMDMTYILALIESEHFGVDESRGATRLKRVRDKSLEIREEAYSHSCIDANGHYQKYDGCGREYLANRLKQYGVIYDLKGEVQG
ncbi:MAG: hypothetical protein IJD79_00710 [Clostridia bacterium]|nr:hypothetical protein [Clostridia bacterium]